VTAGVVVDVDMGPKVASNTVVIQRSEIATVAGCGGGLTLNPSLTPLAQLGPTLEWGGRGSEVV
jgi:hypothetical protein